MTSTSEKILLAALLLKKPTSGATNASGFPPPVPAYQGPVFPGGPAGPCEPYAPPMQPGYMHPPIPQKAPPYRFGPEEKAGAYAPIFHGYYGSGASQIAGGLPSGPLGGLDGYGGGFKGPVGGINGMIVGFNEGAGQGGPMGGFYSTLLGQAGYGQGGYGGAGFFPSGFLTGAR